MVLQQTKYFSVIENLKQKYKNVASARVLKFCSFNQETMQFKVYYLVAQGCKKVNSSKYDRLRYEMIGETQPEMELLEVVAFIYPSSLKVYSSIPSATRI